MTQWKIPMNNEKAIELFLESEKLDKNSKCTLIGLGKCYFYNY